MFNFLNSDYVKNQNITFGPLGTATQPGFGTPLDILQPRTLRLAAQLRF